MQPFDSPAPHAGDVHEAPATRAELLALSARVDIRFAQIDDRFTALEERVDTRFAHFEHRMDARFAHFEHRMEARFAHFESRAEARSKALETRSKALEERFDVRFGHLESSVSSMAATLIRLEEKIQHGASRAWVLGGVTTVLLSVIGAGWWLTQQYLPAVLKAAAGAQV